MIIHKRETLIDKKIYIYCKKSINNPKEDSEQHQTIL